MLKLTKNLINSYEFLQFCPLYLKEKQEILRYNDSQNFLTLVSREYMKFSQTIGENWELGTRTKNYLVWYLIFFLWSSLQSTSIIEDLILDDWCRHGGGSLSQTAIWMTLYAVFFVRTILPQDIWALKKYWVSQLHFMRKRSSVSTIFDWQS